MVVDTETDMVQLGKTFLQQTIAEGNQKLKNELKEELNQSFEKLIDEKLNGINKTLQKVQEDLKETQNTANLAYNHSDTNANNITKLEEKVKKLEDVSNLQQKMNEDLHHRETGYKESINTLKTLLDDQVNRSMMSSLVFRRRRTTPILQRTLFPTGPSRTSFRKPIM